MDEFASDQNWAVLLAKASLEGRCRTAEAKKEFLWTSCQDFTVEVGEQQINAYIKTWGLDPCWLYSLDFLFSTEESEHGAHFYHYRARFSTPTGQKPIPDTASVFFLVKVTTTEPHPLPVEVRFIVESNRLVHEAGETRFSEKWLSYVIYSKALFRTMLGL